MATIAAAASGDWNNTATWTGGVIPGNGDIITIGTGITVTVTDDRIIGTSPAENSGTYAIDMTVGTANIVITGAKLTVRGDIRCVGNATVRNKITIQNSGSNPGILEFDSSQAASPTSQNYRLITATANSQFNRIKMIGTASARAEMRSNAGGGNAFITNNGFIMCGLLDASYATFTRMGDATNPVFAGWWLGNDGKNELKLADVIFDSCGQFNDTAHTPHADADLDIRRVLWKNTQHATYSIQLGPGPATNKGFFVDCDPDKKVKISEAQHWTIDGSFFHDDLEMAGTTTWDSAYNVLLRSTNTSSPTQVCGNLYNWYVIKDSTGTNPHGVSPRGNLTLNIDRFIFEYLGSAVNGDIINIGGSGVANRVVTVRRAIMLANSAGGQPGKLCSILGSNNLVTAEHNTVWSDGSGGNLESGVVAYGETYSGADGMIVSVKSNLVLGATADSGVVITRNPSSSVQLSDASIASHNGKWRPLPGTDGNGYHAYGTGASDIFSPGTPGASDVTLSSNPCVDATRNMRTWSTSLGGAGTATDAMAELRKRNDASGFNSSYTFAALVSYIEAGFKVTDSALVNTGHDSTTIGAAGAAVSNDGTSSPVVGFGASATGTQQAVADGSAVANVGFGASATASLQGVRDATASPVVGFGATASALHQSGLVTIATAQNGFWDDSATWVGGVVPVPGNIVTIGHEVTIRVAADIGHSPAENSGTYAIDFTAATAKLTIDGVRLQVRGDIRMLGNATVRDQIVIQSTPTPGQEGVLEFDSSLATSPTSQNYRLIMAQGNGQFARLRMSGTVQNRAYIQSEASGAPAFITRNGFASCGNFVADYGVAVRIGDASNPFFDSSVGNDAKSELILRDFIFDTCGRLICQVTPNAGAALELRRVLWKNSQHATYSALFGRGPTTTGGFFVDCDPDKTVQFGECASWTIDGSMFYGNLEVAGSTRWVSAANVFVRSTTISSATAIAGDISDWYVWKNGTSVNPHGITPRNGTGDTLIDGIIFEYDGSSAVGDLVNIGLSSVGRTITVRRAIMTRGSGGNQIGKLCSILDSGNIVVAEHNTIWSNGSGGNLESGVVAYGESYAGVDGMISSVKSNLVLGTVAGGAVILTRNPSSTVQLSSAALAANNATYNGLSGTDGVGYHAYGTTPPPIFSSGTPGSGDKVLLADPCIDSSRTGKTWDASLGGPGTIANAATQIRKRNDLPTAGYNSQYTIANLTAYIRYGFRVKDANLHNAGHDGVTIGSEMYFPVGPTLAQRLIVAPSRAWSRVRVARERTKKMIRAVAAYVDGTIFSTSVNSAAIVQLPINTVSQGIVQISGIGGAPLVLDTISVGMVPILGTGVASLSFNTVSYGNPDISGQSLASLALDIAAVGEHSGEAISVVTLPIDTLAVGSVSQRGVGLAVLPISMVAAGAVEIRGAAAAVLPLSASSSATIDGSATVSVSLGSITIAGPTALAFGQSLFNTYRVTDLSKSLYRVTDLSR